MSTVHICLNDILGVAVACEVILYPGDTPFFNGAALAVSGARSIRLDAEGNGSVTLLPGRYAVRFSEITSNTDTLFIQVPNDDAEYPLSELICGGNWVLPMRDFLQKSKNLSDAADPAAAFNAIKQASTTASAGAICIASQAEVDAGTDATKAVTPATLANLAKWATAGQKVNFITTADEPARFALTATHVNVGDLVEQLDTRNVYEVLDTALLAQNAGYIFLGTRPASSNTGLGASLVAYWKLDEESGVRADATGNGNDLADNNGVGFTAGKIGNCAESVSGQWLSSSNPITLSGDFTLSGWAKRSIANGPDGCMIGMGSQALALSCWWFGGSDYILFLFNGDFVARTGPIPLIDLTQWHHLAAVKRSGAITLYLDAVPVELDPSYPGNDSTDVYSGAVGVGADGYGSWTPQLGSLDVDEAGIWNRALSADEIAQLYNNGNGLAYPFA